MAQRRRLSPLLAAIVAVIAIAVTALAPAALVGSHLSRVTRGGIRLVDSAGTIWHGRGVFAAGATRVPFAWRVEPLPLLRGELRVAIGPEPGTPAGWPHAGVTISGDRVSLRDVHATLPVGPLAAAAGVNSAWVAGGELDIDAASILWAPPSNQGAVELRWRRARIVVAGNPRPLDLGDVAATLTADRDVLSGPVSNVSGDLGLRGEIRLRAGDALRVSLVLTPRRDDIELARALAVLGAADGTGWRVEWRLPLQ
jgi:hypothetical protein